MPERLPVLKTYKLYIGGAFPRSESGRTSPMLDADGKTAAYSCRASRKDLRDAVGAARKAQPAWAGTTPYLRGQILYRMAEMLEGKRAEFLTLLTPTLGDHAAKHIDASVDRLVALAGWADKFQHVLGCQNGVSAPYWNITVPEPTGLIAVICPPDSPLLALVSLVAPVICSGNAAVVITPADAAVVSTFGEVCATSDLPGGVVNLLTGSVDELAPIVSRHRDIDGVHAAGVSDPIAKTLAEGVAENLKRVKVRSGVHWSDTEATATPWWIEPFVEFKTVWHPIGA